MAITTRDGLIDALIGNPAVQLSKGAIASIVGSPISLFRVGGGNPPVSSLAIPTTAGRVLNRASSGAIPIPDVSVSGKKIYVAGAKTSMAVACTVVISDRLVEYGGLSGIVTTAQTVSAQTLPTRAGTGVGCELWLEWYFNTGVTASAVVTASYTNSAGTAGRTATIAGGIPASVAAYRNYKFDLEGDDVGVQSVQSVTLGTSTGTAGGFGPIIRKPITMFGSAVPNVPTVLGYAETGLPEIVGDACVEVRVISTTTSTGIFFSELKIIQG